MRFRFRSSAADYPAAAGAGIQSAVYVVKPDMPRTGVRSHVALCTVQLNSTRTGVESDLIAGLADTDVS